MGFVKFHDDVLVENTPKQAVIPVSIEETNISKLADMLLLKSSEGLSAIEQLKSTMEQIAAAAEESAGAAEQTLSSITQIKQNSKFLETEVSQTIEVIFHFKELINNAIDSFIEASDSLKLTSNKAESIAIQSEKLFNASNQINDAVDLITKLSKKTGLLALNAAIEAARAGEDGRSFTVMASEIRAMAKKSDIFAQKIRNIVEDIQVKIKSSNEDIVDIKQAVENFSQDSLNLANEMRKIGDMIENIVLSSHDMLSNVKTTVKEIDKLHQISETISVAAEESASAVSEVTNTISSQVKAFNDAQKAAELLQKLVSKENFHTEIATASEELGYSIESLEISMQDIVEALSQIEEAADISNDDATKAQNLSQNAVEFIQKALDDVNKISNGFSDINISFKGISDKLEIMRQDSTQNIQKSDAQKEAINEIKSKIRKLNNAIRKIELSIVQIGALSISGAVEAVRIGDGGEGFSEVSHDIRNLADTSEENLDRVIGIIDEVNEENDKILVEINNIILTLESESNKLKETTNEFENSLKTLNNVVLTTDKLKQSIEEMNTALEQIKIASSQTTQAAELSKTNATQSKEAANIILNIAKEMKGIIDKLKEISINLVKSEQ